MISMSVAHTAIASTRTRTSVGPGSGTGFSTTDSSSGPPRTQAFMLAGMGYWLPREPASGCGLAMVLPSYAVAADFGSARAGVDDLLPIPDVAAVLGYGNAELLPALNEQPGAGVMRNRDIAHQHSQRELVDARVGEELFRLGARRDNIARETPQRREFRLRHR